MSAIGLLRRLADNSMWSNARLHRACAAIGDVAYHAARESFFGSIHATLDHIALVDRLYLARIEGTASGLEQCESLGDDLATLTRLQRESDRELVELCGRLDAAGLDARVSYRRDDGVRCVERVEDLLAHLFVHQIHHRGQVHALLSQAAAAPPQLDEFFLESDAPRRRDELLALGLGAAGPRQG